MTVQTDEGMVTISYVLATGLSLIVLTWCAMFIIMSYARASIRGASERATRAGIVAYTSTHDLDVARVACQNTFESDLNQGLHGVVRSGFLDPVESLQKQFPCTLQVVWIR